MRRGAYENGIVEVRVWVDAWQMQCCGEPFAVGDAAAMIHGLEHGLKLLEEISGQMAGHHRLAAVQAHLYERAGDREAAIAAYSAALRGTTACVSSNT
jgi:hypothetical protein